MLDCSGSMSLKNKWQSVMKSLKIFVNFRKQINIEGEEISIILFDNKSNVVVKRIKIQDFSTNLINGMTWGSTDFLPAMQNAI